MGVIFHRFFTTLREQGVPVTLKEWLLLLEALDRGVVEQSLESFYRLSRAILVKDEAYYDRFDRAFLIAFKDAEPPDELLERILAGLVRDGERRFSAEELAKLRALGLDEVLRRFFEQLKAGHYRGHVGGDKAIGTRGTSTQGADGYHPTGVRVGQEHGRHRRAIQIAEFRRFRAYDKDRVLDTRGMRVALARLRRREHVGPATELDLEATIDRTARDGGEITLVFRPERRNTRRVLLLTDVGGSMSGFADLVSRFFSAMRAEIRELIHYYFHNCVYEEVWHDAARRHPVPLSELLERYGRSHMLVMVGDAAMGASELLHPGGAIDLWVHNPRPGIEYLRELRERFQRAVWLNPEPRRNWDHVYTIGLIRSVFPMYPLTEEGIVAAVDHLIGRGRRRVA